ncbi:MAG TPA: DUF998 domain-containing protein [Dyella sp.]|uniref:DUF998 domain-containing protein n=1 Tax=Dyella sp. TaxID=1869338 RepID=UPI002C5600B4|nr:DUF998 domain-containing protein [Dyella sp.]HTV85817.1 DUF998 domain-containing protein [Dyella sp.]
MRQILLRFATVLPLLGMLIPMMAGLFAPGYSSIHQHMSELELLSPSIALACRFGAIISGLSIMGFALALVLQQESRMLFTAGMAVIFGISMIANGIFTMGSPWHGMYAIGLSIILVPAFFAAESNRNDRISLVVSSITLVYMWALMTGIDPKPIHGLTQRIATIPMFGWFSYASLTLLGGATKRAR